MLHFPLEYGCHLGCLWMSLFRWCSVQAISLLLDHSCVPALGIQHRSIKFPVLSIFNLFPPRFYKIILCSECWLVILTNQAFVKPDQKIFLVIQWYIVEHYFYKSSVCNFDLTNWYMISAQDLFLRNQRPLCFFRVVRHSVCKHSNWGDVMFINISWWWMIDSLETQ